MTTTVTTITKSAEVFTRTWTDLDPKVRNALASAAAADLLALGGWLKGAVGLHALLLAVAVSLLPVIAAYVTTSKHRQIIREGVAAADEVAHDVAPVVKELAPQAAPAVDGVVDAVDTVNAALEQPVAGLPAPVAATTVQ